MNNNYKKEWTDEEEQKVISVFKKWESDNLILTYGKRERKIINTYGLPYTSSSGFAMVSNTNVKAELKENRNYRFNWLALNNNNKVVAGFTDVSENEITIIIGQIYEVKKMINNNKYFLTFEWLDKNTSANDNIIKVLKQNNINWHYDKYFNLVADVLGINDYVKLDYKKLDGNLYGICVV